MDDKSKEIVNNIFQESAEIRRNMTQELINDIHEASLEMVKCLENNGVIYAMGNGGSAADAQHFTAELVGKYYKIERRAMPAIALTTNTSIITAISNDTDYSKVFSRQLEAFISPKDLLMGISTSGNSESILNGFKMAFNKGAKTVFLTGRTGGKISETMSQLNHVIKVPTDNTARIQEMHITIIHIFCEVVEYEMFRK